MITGRRFIEQRPDSPSPGSMEAIRLNLEDYLPPRVRDAVAAPLIRRCWACALVLTQAIGAEPRSDWAYRPAQHPVVPEIRSPKSEIRNPIDAFLLAKLSEKKLAFAPEADRRTLIRRVYFDLIGLPPTPEEIEAFVDGQVARRLREGRRQTARLAAVRRAAWPSGGSTWCAYAETDGFKADDIRPNAWRYRDYVIRSLQRRQAVRPLREGATRRRRTLPGRPGRPHRHRLSCGTSRTSTTRSTSSSGGRRS